MHIYAYFGLLMRIYCIFLNQNFKDSQKYKSLNWTCNVIVGDRAQSSDSNPV